MIAAKDRRVERTLVRAAKDYRSSVASLPVYPGLHTASGATDLDEARTNFEFVWNGRSGASRFTDGSWPVLYTANLRRTACSEVGYHLQEIYLSALVPGSVMSCDHILYSVRVRGKRRMLSHADPDREILCGNTSSAIDQCRSIAQQAKVESVAALCAPSARDDGASCYPILLKTAVDSPSDARSVRLEIDHDISRIVLYSNGRRERIQISRKFDGL